MAFHLRKLLNDSSDDSVDKMCERYCDPIKNPEGGCPLPCLVLASCLPVCKHPLYTEIPPPPDVGSHPSRTFGLPVYLSISLALLATAFFAFSCYSVYKFYRGRHNSRSRELSAQPPSQPPQEEEAHLQFLEEDQGLVVDHPIWYIRTIGLQPSVIRAITICKYKKDDGLVEGTDCSVCLNEFQDGETLRLLPKCNHAFHIPCIDTWLASHTNCPNCRAGIVMTTPNFQSTAISPQNSAFNSGLLEEFQVGVSGDYINRESERESESESEVAEVSIDVGDEEESRINRSSMVDVEGGSDSSSEGEGIQPMRRSVSLDTLSASVVNAAIANAFSAQSERNKDKNFMEMNGLTEESAPKEAGSDQRGSSTERSLQKETSLVKRSLSCSAKVFLSRYGKSRNSSLPP